MVDELCKDEAITNIRNYDKKAKGDTEKVTVQIEKIMEKLEKLNSILKG